MKLSEAVLLILAVFLFALLSYNLFSHSRYILLALLCIFFIFHIRYWWKKRQVGEYSHESDPHGFIGYLPMGKRKRNYYLHLPSRLPNQKIPLVMAFHGGQGNAQKFSDMTNFNAIADRENFAVVYPNACGYWNDGRESTTSKSGNDLLFVKHLVDHLVRTRNIDERRIYATGASSGGMFTFRLACEMPNRFAAFATVIASMPVPLKLQCEPSAPVALLMINGTEDKLMPWQGGTIPMGQRRGAGGEVVSVPETLAFWQRCNGCWSASKVEAVLEDPYGDGTVVKILDYPCRKKGAALKLVAIEGGGHTWPGMVQPPPVLARIVGKTSHAIDASETIWLFFRDRILQYEHQQNTDNSGMHATS
ncbi:MAG: PHB depolymerase family esterase [Candidatus Competibacter sp.]|nr:PHB depolymerase family esterase [Candidatus Competibacter sp.]